MTREKLEVQAKELGIDVDGRWSDDTLQEKIDAEIEAQQDIAEPETEVSEYVNRHNGLLQLSDGSIIKPGGVASLTSEQLALKDVQAAIKSGFLAAK